MVVVRGFGAVGVDMGTGGELVGTVGVGPGSGLAVSSASLGLSAAPRLGRCAPIGPWLTVLGLGSGRPPGVVGMLWQSNGEGNDAGRQRRMVCCHSDDGQCKKDMVCGWF